MRCLQDIINDEYFTKYGDYSEIDIKYAASLGNSASPQFDYEYGSPIPTQSHHHLHLISTLWMFPNMNTPAMKKYPPVHLSSMTPSLNNFSLTPIIYYGPPRCFPLPN